MEFRVLGPLEVHDGNGAIALAAGKQRALLADLLLHANRAVSIDTLVDDLWGDHVPGTAVKTLQVYVSKLRKALPSGRVRTTPPGYLLHVADGELDLHLFESLAGEGRAALAAGRHEDASALLGRALALWRGPALAELDEPFARAEGARLDEARIACLEDRVEADLALGRHAALAGELQALAGRHPLRERLRSQLMLALYRSGRQAEALAAYQAFRRTLGDDLGLEPSLALRELERRLLRQDPGLDLERDASAPSTRPALPPAAPGGPPQADAIVVGRDAELSRLESLFGEVEEGHRRLVFVTGESGAGKTTLVSAFLARVAAGDDLLVGRGQCIEHRGAGEPYLPVLEALAGLCRAPGGAEVVGLLRTHAPTWLVELPWLLSDAEQADLRQRVVGATRDRMLREMLELLDALGAGSPLVLVLEDLHWSDVSTVDLLDAVARRPEPARLLVIGTYRPQDAAFDRHPLRSLAQHLRSRDLCVEVGLASLSEEDTLEYVRRRLPGNTLPEEVGRLLGGRTRGNPLYMEKLLDAWIDSGAVRPVSGAWALIVPVADLAGSVPATLRSLIELRFLQLEEADRRLLEAASVAGAEFTGALAAAAAEMDEQEAEERLDALAREGMFVELRGDETWPDGTLSGQYAFTHDLCQEVLAERLPSARRGRVHRQIAMRLERAYGSETAAIAARLAWHSVNGRDAERAVRHLQGAAHQALQRNAFREALGHLQTALEALASLPAGEARARLELGVQTLIGLPTIAVEGWLSEAAESAFLRARTLAEELGDEEQLALVLYRLATLHEFRGEYVRAESLLEETLALPDRAESIQRAADSHELLACSLFHQGRHREAVAHADRALRYIDHVEQDRASASVGEAPVVSCHVWAALATWNLGLPDRARDRAEKAVASSTVGAARHGRAMAQAETAVVHQFRREPALALRWAEAAIAEAALSGYDYWRAVGTVVRGWAAAQLGEAPAGLRDILHGVALARSTGARVDDAYFAGLLADASLAAGNPDDALAAADEGLASLGPDRQFFYEPELHRVRGLALAELDRGREAGESLRSAVATARALGSPPLELRAAVSLARAGDETAAAIVAERYRDFTEGLDTPDLVEARALLLERGVPIPVSGVGAAAAEAPPVRPPVRYARSGELSIAYQVTGEGPVDVVLVPGFVSHLDKDWENPGHVRFLERLGSFSRLTRFDKRGTGMSDRPEDLPDLETRMDDVRAVMDATGVERAVLFGYSEGGPLSILFAATYPERVLSLVLYGAFVKRSDPDEDYPWAPTPEDRAAYIESLADDWGHEASMRTMCPSADEETARWWGERARAAASPGAIVKLMRMNSRIDVRDILRSIRVPTLVLHRVGDLDVSVEEGRYIAGRIPGATFVELAGGDHFVSIDPDQILDVVEPFVTGVAAAPPGAAAIDERVLATIVITDIAHSTERAVSLGDRGWTDLLERHHALVRRELERFSGEEVDTAGDGFFALFDGPARALRCARAIQDAVSPLGVQLRIGVHTGEIERRGRSARGVAVHLAARVAAEAEPGEVLVSATTHDLVEGAGIAFAERGEALLRGFERPRRLYAVLAA